MKTEFVVAILVALLSGGAWKYLPDKFAEWKNRKRIASEADEKKKAERQERDRDTWFRESKTAYRRVERECESCRSELAATRKENADTRKAVYRLLETLEDQVIPMLGLPDVDPRDVRVAARAAVQQCRDSL